MIDYKNELNKLIESSDINIDSKDKYTQETYNILCKMNNIDTAHLTKLHNILLPIKEKLDEKVLRFIFIIYWKSIA